MCQEVKVTAGAMVVSSLLTKAGALFVAAAGTAAAVYVLAQGSVALAWLMVGLTAWAAVATIGWIVAVASPRRKVAVRQPAGRRPAVVVEVRPALESAKDDPLARLVVSTSGHAGHAHHTRP